VSGKKLDDTYKLAWVRGLKTTYYLRSMGATAAEKSTVRAGSLNAVPSDGAMAKAMTEVSATEIKYCAIDDESCESCQ
jgi:ribonucleoside-diphosphate reductase alpha chain